MPRHPLAAAALAFCALFACAPLAAHALTADLLATTIGSTAGSNLGSSMANAGDVNRDGYDDIIIGASGINKAYVYFGGPAADTTADWVLTGVAGESFGSSVASAGDVNADGYGDVIVGALHGTGLQADAGRALVFFGGASPNTVADWIVLGKVSVDGFGTAVCGDVDINEDGFADIVVGAPGSDDFAANSGAIYIYYGGVAPNTAIDVTLGDGYYFSFGKDLANAGDFDGDDRPDLLIGGDNIAIVVPARRLNLLFGSYRLNRPDGTAIGGWSVAAAGDVNADGFADVVVGEPSSQGGHAYVYYGGPFARDFGVPQLTLAGTANDRGVGDAVAGLGDVDGDGYDDVAVGVGEDAFGQSAGRALVFLGGPVADSIPDISMAELGRYESYGTTIAGVGDQNGDGRADLLVGAQEANLGHTVAGAVFLYSFFEFRLLSPRGGENWVAGRTATVRWQGRAPADIALSVDGGATYTTLASRIGGHYDNTVTIAVPSTPTTSARVRVSEWGQEPAHSRIAVSPAVFRIAAPTLPAPVTTRSLRTLNGVAAGDNFGRAAAAVGDVNGDGAPDYAIGAQGNDAGGLDAGRVYVFFGGAASDGVADWTLTGAAVGDGFGTALAGAGDVNADGYADLIVGAMANDAGGASAGRAYVFFGGTAPDAVADWTLTGLAAGDLFGVSLAGAGDVNGDGFGDVIVGASDNDSGGSNAGRATVFFGGLAPNTVADISIVGAAAGEQLGYAVGAAGDVNGDGFGDVVAGAPMAAGGAGRAQVYFGGQAPDAVADLVVHGDYGAANLGTACGSAGDVNGDGVSDLFVGASGNFNEDGTEFGRALVFFGGASVDTLADWTLTAAVTGDEFGRQIAAGDINGDGFADLACGATASSAHSSLGGRVEVYFGGVAPDTLADLVLGGAAANDQFGVVAVIGDVTGNGCADLLVGAGFVDTPSVDAGRAYLYDAARYVVLSPAGGETWNVGAMKTVSWRGAALADVWLSVDGGVSYERIAASAGGGATNSIAVRVPHTPSRFARVRVAPHEASLAGFGQSDSTFTIQTSIALLGLSVASAPQGVIVSWRTDPGPADLASYTLEREADAAHWITVATTRDTSVVDPSGSASAHYRLLATNGLGETIQVGETAGGPGLALAAYPQPLRTGGALTVRFTAASAAGDTDVSVYDIRGRRVATLAHGRFAAGDHTVTWDGRDAHGRALSSGVYELRLSGAASAQRARVLIAR